MSIYYNEKGKFFTDVVSKNAMGVIIQTVYHRIMGLVYVRPGARLKDEINSSDQFIAVTNATIYEADGKEIYQSNFLTINRDQIIWLMPAEEIVNEQELEGGEA